VQEYDLCVPLCYNDGRPIAPQKFPGLQKHLLEQCGGLTFFPQPHAGFWTMAGVTYRDAMVIYRGLTADEQAAQRYWSALTERLQEALQQEESLIVARAVETLSLIY